MSALASDGMEIVDFAFQFVRREKPEMFLQVVDDTLAYRILSIRGAAIQCLHGSCLMLALATVGVWWLALPCLPLSLLGAHFARMERRLRRRWSAPVVREFPAPISPLNGRG